MTDKILTLESGERDSPVQVEMEQTRKQLLDLADQMIAVIDIASNELIAKRRLACACRDALRDLDI